MGVCSALVSFVFLFSFVFFSVELRVHSDATLCRVKRVRSLRVFIALRVLFGFHFNSTRVFALPSGDAIRFDEGVEIERKRNSGRRAVNLSVGGAGERKRR